MIFPLYISLIFIHFDQTIPGKNKGIMETTKKTN